MPHLFLLAAMTGALAAVAVPASASDATKPRTELAATDPTLNPDEIRCRRIEMTGSRIPSKRVCRTNAEWDRMARVGNEAARAIVDKSIGIANETP
jgi:hypothetical protein